MKHIFFSFLILLLVLLIPQPTYAWGDGIPGALLKQSMEQIQKGIEGTILGAIKTAAITSIVNQVDRLLGGVGVGQPRYIRNYDDYLRVQPQMEAETQVYNFLSRTYRSLGSSANYTSAASGANRSAAAPARPTLGVYIQPVGSVDTATLTRARYTGDKRSGLFVSQVVVGSSADASIDPGDILLEIDGRALVTNEDFLGTIASHNVGDRISVKYLREGRPGTVSITLATLAGGGAASVQGGYEAKLEQTARQAVVNRNSYRYDLNEYCLDPEAALRQGDLRCLDAWRNNPMNNQYGAALRAESEYQRIRDEVRYQRQVMATSSGFLPNVDSRTGQIATPSGTIMAVYNDAQTLASRILAAAQNPAELASGIVFALVNRTINTIAMKAAGAVESVVDKTVGRAVTEINRISGDIGNVLRTVDGYILTANGYITEAGYQAEQANRLRQQVNSSTKAPPAALPATGTPGTVPCTNANGTDCSRSN